MDILTGRVCTQGLTAADAEFGLEPGLLMWNQKVIFIKPHFLGSDRGNFNQNV